MFYNHGGDSLFLALYTHKNHVGCNMTLWSQAKLTGTGRGLTSTSGTVYPTTDCLFGVPIHTDG